MARKQSIRRWASFRAADHSSGFVGHVPHVANQLIWATPVRLLPSPLRNRFLANGAGIILPRSTTGLFT